MTKKGPFQPSLSILETHTKMTSDIIAPTETLRLLDFTISRIDLHLFGSRRKKEIRERNARPLKFRCTADGTANTPSSNLSASQRGISQTTTLGLLRSMCDKWFFTSGYLYIDSAFVQATSGLLD